MHLISSSVRASFARLRPQTVSAPLDGLYAATLVNEWAVEAATAMLRGGEPPDLAAAADGIRREIADERNPALVAPIPAS